MKIYGFDNSKSEWGVARRAHLQSGLVYMDASQMLFTRAVPATTAKVRRTVRHERNGKKSYLLSGAVWQGKQESLKLLERLNAVVLHTQVF